jgi:MFS family permease
MNRLKNKRVFAIGVCIVLIIGAIAMAVVFQKLDFPLAWVKTCFYISFVGAGGIGVIIGLYIHSIPHQDKYQDSRLKIKARIDYITLFKSTIIGFLAFGFLVYKDIKGKDMIIGMIVMVICIAIGFFLKLRKDKKQTVPDFDEREFYLIQRASNIGNNCFMGYVVAVMFVAFSLIGGRVLVPMWTIPMVLFSGIFIGGTVQFLVLMHYAKEDDKNTEGGVA